MRRSAILPVFVLAGCTAQTPAIHMRFVDETDNSPVADARVSFCATAWGGTLTGHGGGSAILFEIETVTDAKGELNVPPREFDARPFGMSTNYDHSRLLVVKPGYEPKKIVNWGAALGEYAAVAKWAYNDMTIGLKRAAGEPKPVPRYGFERQCGDNLIPAAEPKSFGMPPPAAPPRPVKAPQDAGSQHRSAAQPAK